MDILYLIAGLAAGILATLFLAKAQKEKAVLAKGAESERELATLRERLSGKDAQITDLQARLAESEKRSQAHAREVAFLTTAKAEQEAGFLEARKGLDEKLEVIEHAREKMEEAFQALSGEALKSNNQAFLELARTHLGQYQESAKGDLEKRQEAIDQMILPVKESLDKIDEKIQSLESSRAGAYSELREQVRSLMESGAKLREETGNLVKALRQPQGRGRWGEIQLKTVVEMAGMVDHCDFLEQESSETGEGKSLRPDMLIKLPGGRLVVVDSKAPLMAYLNAAEAKTDEEREEFLADHARQIRTHLGLLGKKAYWDQFESAPEFVVMFLPGEDFFSSALRKDPALIEAGVENKVILATPTTLIALLKAVSYGWRQEQLSRNAQKISELGKELYKRLADMTEHLADMGNNLKKAVLSYNKGVGSFETRVVVKAREFKELGIGETAKDMGDLEPIETVPRETQGNLLND